MSGSLARRGFRFQDLYLLRRILEETASCLAADVFGADTSKRRSNLRFGIEARTSVSGSSDWDSIISSVDQYAVVEAKSGAISKQDRIAFWRRLRREAHKGNDKSIHAILVVDPTHEDTEKWQKLAGAAAGNGVSRTIPKEPSRVSNADDLLAEALWAMCSVSNADRNESALSLEKARQVVSTFTIEAIDFDQLEASVLDGIELLFPSGMSDQLSDSILGWLNRRAAHKEQPLRLFTIRELLGEMTVLRDCAAFDTGTIARWKALWAELPALFRQRARTRLGAGGQAIPIREVQPAIDQALTEGLQMLVIVGQSGGGKTALLAQFGLEAQNAGAEVFECNADAISEDEVEDLVTSLRFRRALLAIRTPSRRMYILVDALDEAEIGLRIRWSKQLARLGVDSRATLVATIRDNAWRSDGTTQIHLQHWCELTLNDWPEELVRTILKNAYPEKAVSAGLLELIRHPLMLDIFWRTFVEAPERRHLREWTPRTRHQLLSVFWQERLVHSVRHRIPALAQRIEEVIGRAAASIGAFDAEGIDPQTLDVLLSESVLVLEGRLNTRYRFRHPLLRDFALGLWCLSASDDASVAERWSLIEGGLQRHGALRAMFEALADPQFVDEHPHLSRSNLVAALLAAHPEASVHVAQVFGACSPDSAFNPATWSQSVQDSLSASFATELLASARLAGNLAWAQPAAAWQANASWIDDRFPHELLSFVGWLRQLANTEGRDSPSWAMARAAAIKLRQLSEHPRFVPQFESNDHWLKMAAMREIIPLVPDEATLAWIEREVPVATWRTRGFLLDQLIHLAPLDSLRIAAVYRSAIGLRKENGIPVLDWTYWQDTLMVHHAIDWSFAGENDHRSLLREFPNAFMPVAFQLAEALPYAKVPTGRRQIDEFIDDYSAWKFWNMPSRRLNASGRCNSAIHKCAEDIADTKTALFFSDVMPLFKASRSLTLQIVYFDLLLSRVESPQFRDALVERILNGRFYPFSAFSYWLERAIVSLWVNLSKEQQFLVLAHIDAIAADDTDEGAALRRAQFLASIPEEDLPPAHRAIAATRLASEFQPLHHPRERPYGGVVPPSSEVDREEYRVRNWPEEFDKEQLGTISRVSRVLARKVTPEKIQQLLPQGLSAAFQLLPVIASQSASLADPNRLWLLEALEGLLEKHGPADPDHDTAGPPFAFVEACADLALTLLETVPYRPNGPSESDDVYPPEALWCHALSLADSALVRAPARDDTRLQDRFTNVLVHAFSNGDAGVQVKVGWSVRSWHWLRSDARRTLHSKLVWGTPREARVLIYSLHTTRHGRDKDRVEIYRSLLARADIDSPETLARTLGEFCGLYSMAVSTDMGRRSGVAALAHEFIDNPDRFPLIQNREARVSFFRSFVFAMQEMAKDHWDKIELAADFATWSLKIWRLLLVIREGRYESEEIVRFTMHWLERQEDETRDQAKLRLWWEQLLPLVQEVSEKGTRPDCFVLFFNLRDPKMQFVLQAEELLAAVDSLRARLEPDIEGDLSELDITDPAKDDHNSWREVLRNAAEALESSRAAGLLRNDFHREKSRQLLSRLAATPFSIEAARTALYRLQNESI